MAKANAAYHKRDLYSEVTTCILAELTRAQSIGVRYCRTPFILEELPMNMHGAIFTLARYEARQIIKRQLYAKGIKLATVESCEITIAANKYIDENPEVIALATARYWDFVKRGILKPERKPRKAGQ